MSRFAWHRYRSGVGSLLVVLCCFTPLSQAGNPANVTYTYDDLGRLRTGDFGGNVRVDYQYDAAGNRTTMASGLTPTLTVGNATSSVAEGTALTFPVTFTGTSATNVTVDCVPQNTGTAQGGGSAPLDDFVTTTQHLTFLSTDPSGTVRNCSITTKTDTYYEGTQTVNVVLQNVSAGAIIAAPNLGTGSILDGNAGPVFAVSGSSIAEGSALTYTITKTGLTEQSHNVSYATANGTATTADSDYTAISTTATTFTSGQTSKQVTVNTTADTKYEGNETVALNLSSATGGATIGTASANGTISNNDATPSITIADATIANEGVLKTFIISNVGNTNTGFTHSISWATANGTATAGTDYTAASGTVVFASGDTQKSIQVQYLTDGVVEAGNETVLVNLTTNGSTNGAVITDSQAVGTIADIDVPAPSMPTNLRKNNGAGGPTTPDYSIVWDASTGPVSYYVLDEDGATVQINAPAVQKSYTNKPSGSYTYKVKACSSTNQCSAFTATINKTVCNGPCQ